MDPQRGHGFRGICVAETSGEADLALQGLGEGSNTSGDDFVSAASPANFLSLPSSKAVTLTPSLTKKR